jgi:hypothetical protein
MGHAENQQFARLACRGIAWRDAIWCSHCNPSGGPAVMES